MATQLVSWVRKEDDMFVSETQTVANKAAVAVSQSSIVHMVHIEETIISPRTNLCRDGKKRDFEPFLQ